MEKRFLEIYNRKKYAIFMSCDVEKFSQLRFLVRKVVDCGRTLLQYWTREDSWLNINLLEQLYWITDEAYKILCEIGKIVWIKECEVFDREMTLFDLIEETKYEGLDMDNLINPTKDLYKAVMLLDRLHRQDFVDMNLLGFSDCIRKPCEIYTRFMINEVIMV